MNAAAASLAQRLGLDAAALQLVAECGYVLLDRGLLAPADEVFAGLAVLVAEHPAGLLGRAAVALRRGDRLAVRAFAIAARSRLQADAAGLALAYRLEAAVAEPAARSALALAAAELDATAAQARAVAPIAPPHDAQHRCSRARTGSEPRGANP